jgi:ORF6N domain
MPGARASPVGDERVAHFILVIRRQRVLLDADLAALYRVETRVLLQAVRRNLERFPPDFMFELSAAEWTSLRSQFVTSAPGRGG